MEPNLTWPSPVNTASVFTHRRPQEFKQALNVLLSIAQRAGVELHFDREETRKIGLTAREGIVIDSEIAVQDVDLCVALGGDGTFLRALRTYAGTDTPTFAINFGEIGFLATVEREDMEPGLARAFADGYEIMTLPAIGLNGLKLQRGDEELKAINDITVHRKPGLRVARLSYLIGPNEVGQVRCDGLVVATPAGSTGYNLANGGPVMAWGVEGIAVSFIAPHSLSARVLIVAPDDVLTVRNCSEEEPVTLAIDGRPVGEIKPLGSIEARFLPDQGRLAQRPGASFYHRLREKFQRLSS